jgi:hypothetical protein
MSGEAVVGEMLGVPVAPEDADPVLVAVPSKVMRGLAPRVMAFGAGCVVVPWLALSDIQKGSSADDTVHGPLLDQESLTFLVAVMVPVGIALIVGGAIALKKSRGTTIAIGSAGVTARVERDDPTVPWDHLAAVWIDVSSRQQLVRLRWLTSVESWIWLGFSPALGPARAVPVRLTTLVWAERHDPTPTIALADHALRRFAGPRYQGVRTRR